MSIILLHRLRSLWRDLFLRRRIEDDLSSEIGSYLEMLVQKKVALGMDPKRARLEATFELGGTEQLKEKVREVRMGYYLESIWQDLRFGARNLTKNRGFAITAISTLALGIGACTAIFSVVNAVLLRSLPYPDPDRIVAIEEYHMPGGDRARITAANFVDWRARNHTFENLAGIAWKRSNLTGAGEPEQINVAVVSANFFDVLRVQPKLGRGFTPEDEQAGHPSIAILSHGLWQRRFGSDPSVIGKQIILDEKSYTVTGVMPAGFQYPKEIEVWVPPLRIAPEVNPQIDVTRNRSMGYLSAIARLKPGVTLQQSAAEMDAITAALRQQYPGETGDRFDRVVSLQTDIVGDIRPALLTLLAAVAGVLLIACANVANLLLARLSARRKEIVLRAALGAGRGRLIRQLMTESILLSLIGGVIGLLLAWLGISLLVTVAPTDLPRITEVNLDWQVLAFTFGVSLFTGILFGLAPVLSLAGVDLHDALKAAGRVTGSAYHHKLGNLLVVAEVTLSIVLLVCAGLLFRSFLKLQSVQMGFDTGNILTMRVNPSGSKYQTLQQQNAFYNDAIGQLKSVPGIQSVGLVSELPLGHGSTTASCYVEGAPELPPSQWPEVNFRIVSPGYFRVLGVPILQGRDIDARDTTESQNVVVVNEAFAKYNFKNESPIGKRITFGNDQQGRPVWYQIVGEIANIRTVEFFQTEPQPDVYLSYGQQGLSGPSFVIKTSIEPTSLAQSAVEAIHKVDAMLPVSYIKSMDQIAYESISQPRFNTLLLAVFASVALLLAAAGIYGVMSYMVTQRTNEIGVRIALGGKMIDILKIVIGRGMILTGSGVALGIAIAFGVSRVMSGLLFGVTPTDPLTFTFIALLLSSVAFLACYIPARKAARVDPMVALRYE
ncbi:MAG TPA: ABC transporter permease [Blastocatellia bacterium]|nr:ABC transporter permease [Blastocatellia bacterium]